MSNTKPGPRRRSGERNSLDIARETFAALTTGPSPVSVDCRGFRGLPGRLVPVDELRDLLLARHCPQSTRDAMWMYLAGRARREGGTWTVVATGVALPALTSVAATLSRRFAGDPSEIHAEVLRGFLSALAGVDLTQPRIMVRLRWAAYRAGHRALREALDRPTPVPSGRGSRPPTPPWGHPDLVLARAVEAGVLIRLEAEVIGATRLDEIPIADWARERGVGEWAAYKFRSRAEHRLAEYLRETTVATDSTDPVADLVLTRTTTEPKQDPTDTAGDEPPHPAPLSRVVTDSEGKSVEKVGPELSKNDPKSGVQGRGESPRSIDSPEVPRCA
ncbi:hypothetical protein CLV68_2487 [Actinokineospora cianjurensis]|uniref:Uncharacterized protein n=1 Tax=Actinokineospora cianjurensis TaxID=585224 RepID=A0A421BC44_9PSEU|nr:hypothetical protein CLV68_2487 [Actinokineospora cianjurensis]